MKAVGHIVEGASAFEAGRFNRKVMRVNATNAERDGASSAARLRDTARLAIGRQIAALSSSGFAGDSGSALDAVRESAIESELEILTVRRRAAAEASAHRLQGQLAYAQGYNAMSAGIISGAASLVDDAAKYAGGGA